MSQKQHSCTQRIPKFTG